MNWGLDDSLESLPPRRMLLAPGCPARTPRSSGRVPACWTHSEFIRHRHLHETRIRSKIPGRSGAGDLPAIRSVVAVRRYREPGRVEQVENIGPELQRLLVISAEVLEDRRVEPTQTRSVHRKQRPSGKLSTPDRSPVPQFRCPSVSFPARRYRCPCADWQTRSLDRRRKPVYEPGSSLTRIGQSKLARPSKGGSDSQLSAVNVKSSAY